MTAKQAKSPSLRIELIVEDESWRKERVAALIRRAASAAYARAGKAKAKMAAKNGDKEALAILLTSDARLRALNAAFRKKNAVTNVLSFGSATPGQLGDIAIAHGRVAREAVEQGKSFAAHAAHLTAHGVLHLLGFDHEAPKKARNMENLERSILARLGISDPYAPVTARPHRAKPTAAPYAKRGKAA